MLAEDADRDELAGVVLHPAETRAVIFDLDGVVASTAALHERAWRDTLAASGGGAELGHEEYRTLLDGRPRLDGARALLGARGLPADDAAVGAFAEAKTARFRAALDAEGAQALPGARALLAALRGAGLGVGLYTASRNAGRVLASLSLEEAFDIRVDGAVAAGLGLAGKPAPDGVLHCAERLGVAPAACAYFEDAVAGIEVGRAAGVGRAIGVGQGPTAVRLRAAGADDVVPSLAAISIAAGHAGDRHG
jgi:beta-phosphoglucomutase family hydrolase